MSYTSTINNNQIIHLNHPEKKDKIIKSSYASNKIEGNPLSEKQAEEVIESDERKHYLKPEQEVRNYFLALNYLEEKVNKKEKLSKN